MPEDIHDVSTSNPWTISKMNSSLGQSSSPSASRSESVTLLTPATSISRGSMPAREFPQRISVFQGWPGHVEKQRTDNSNVPDLCAGGPVAPIAPMFMRSSSPVKSPSNFPKDSYDTSLTSTTLKRPNRAQRSGQKNDIFLDSDADDVDFDPGIGEAESRKGPQRKAAAKKVARNRHGMALDTWITGGKL